jgi:hypothetical protein
MRVDMSPQGITTRLKRASQLRRLCLSLGKAKEADRREQAVTELSDPLQNNDPLDFGQSLNMKKWACFRK